jgi:hypothetical protein
MVDTFGGTQTNSYVTETEDKVDWYTPPPLPLMLSLPPPPTLPVISPQSNTFELGMSLSFHDGSGQAKTVVYEGVMPDSLSHTVRHQDGSCLNVHDAHLCLKMQADLSNIPRTPLDYCKEVGKGITKEEAENLACPRILMPIQQELMDWHHHLYPRSFVYQRRVIYQRACSNAKERFPSALHVRSGLLIGVLGDCAARPQGPSVALNTFFQVTVFWLIK